MAQCEEGYLCDVCGKDVEAITESDLYLSYVLGEVPAEDLNIRRERHIRCNPTMAQFIVDERFAPVVCEGPFAKACLDPEFVAEQERRLTRGWLRLQELPGLGLPLTEYPLPEVLEARRQGQTRAAGASGPANRTEYAERMRNWQAAAAEVHSTDREAADASFGHQPGDGGAA